MNKWADDFAVSKPPMTSVEPQAEALRYFLHAFIAVQLNHISQHLESRRWFQEFAAVHALELPDVNGELMTECDSRSN